MKILEPREAEWDTEIEIETPRPHWLLYLPTCTCIWASLFPSTGAWRQGRGRRAPGREDAKRTGRSCVFFAAWGDVTKIRGMAFRRILAFSILILWLLFKPECLRLIMFICVFLNVCWVMKTIAFGNRISQTGLYEMTNLPQVLFSPRPPPKDNALFCLLALFSSILLTVQYWNAAVAMRSSPACVTQWDLPIG